MKLSKTLLLPITLPYALFVFVRFVRANGGGDKANAISKELHDAYNRKMAALDVAYPQGSYTHTRLAKALRKSCRQRIKEASVKKS